MRYHYPPIRMAIIWNSDNNKCWQGCGAIGTLIHSWWECKMVQPLWKTPWWFLTKPNILLLYNPAIVLQISHILIPSWFIQGKVLGSRNQLRAHVSTHMRTVERSPSCFHLCSQPRFEEILCTPALSICHLVFEVHLLAGSST